MNDRRSQRSFGGLIPVGGVARSGDTAVVPLCVEVHADGASLPLLMLSDSSGPLVFDPAIGASVSDDTGREYRVRGEVQHLGLGVLQADLWINPAPPPRVRTLRVAVDGIARTAITRRGDAVARLLSGGPWQCEIGLVPTRTVAPIPSRPGSTGGPTTAEGPARVPARAFGSLREVVGIGQARLTATHAVCLWALERYLDREVLTVGALTDAETQGGPLAGGAGDVQLWDDHGRSYRVAPISSCVRSHSSETSLEVTPAIADDVFAIGVRVALDDVGGAVEFGVAMTPTGGR